MALFGPPDVERLKSKGNVNGLIKALSYKKDWRIREFAARALGQLKDAQAVAPLLTLAYEDYVDEVRDAAANALPEIGASAVDPLIEALSEFGLREIAGYALAKIGEPAVEQLSNVLLKGWFQAAGQTAAKALGQIGSEAAFNALVSALFSEDKTSVEAASKTLVRIGEPAVEYLNAAVKERNGKGNIAADILDQIKKQQPKRPRRKKQATSS